MIDLPPQIILPERPAIIRPAVDLARYFPVELNRAERRAAVSELVKSGRLERGAIPFGMFSVAEVDPNFANVSCLLHFNGSNGSTSFVDSGPLGLSVTASGNAQISTAQSKFGGSSLLLDGAGDYISIAAGTHFSFGTGAWTMEFWIRTSQTDATWALMFGVGLDTAGQMSLGYNHDGNGSMRWVERLTVRITATSTGINSGAWRHVAITRSSNSVRMFIDGVQQGSTYTTSYTYGMSGTTLRLGAYGGGVTGEEITGNVDDLRVTKGVARYTANFTPPTSQFPDSA